MNIQPNIFITADTHFGHEKQVTLWGKRPPEFEKIIVDNWNSTVKKGDTVLHLGDLTMTNKENTFNWTSKLNGNKFLIRGNHDEASDTWYSDCGFQVIPPSYKKFSDKHVNIYNVLFTHEPVVPLPQGNWFNIHGHLHGDSHRLELKSDRHYDAGVDPRNFTPVRLAEILVFFKSMLSPK